jgi:DNA-3-methyladenine glycosylase II
VAAHLLWAYYHAVKRREGVMADQAKEKKPASKSVKAKKKVGAKKMGSKRG